jgi:hypothetical protein
LASFAAPTGRFTPFDDFGVAHENEPTIVAPLITPDLGSNVPAVSVFVGTNRSDEGATNDEDRIPRRAALAAPALSTV